MNQLRERPGTMKRFVDGVTGEFFFQKRVPKNAPDWLETATFTFPSGRTATELVANDAAHLVWAVNLGVIDFNPHPVRRADLDCPDELRVDLDPHARASAGTRSARSRCASRRSSTTTTCAAIPKTSGSRGIHVNVRIEPRWDYVEVRRAALALAREVERREPKHATSKWWKEERHGVFVDYNQNARDRTIASGYSVRPVPDAASAARSSGTRSPTSSPASCGSTRSRPGSRSSATPRPTSTSTPARSTSCSTSPAATRRRASATPRGLPTSASSAASRSGCSPRRTGRRRARTAPAASPSARPGRARRAAPGSSRACWPARAARRRPARADRRRCR